MSGCNKYDTDTAHLSGLVAEIFDGESDDGRRSVVGAGPPRQPGGRLRDLHHVGPRRRAGERRRLGGAVEDDARVGRRLDDQVGVPRGLASIAGCLARVQTRVGPTKICNCCHVITLPGVRRIMVRGSMPPCRLRRRKCGKFDYEMVHSEVYLSKYVVNIAPAVLYTCLHSHPHSENRSFCMCSLFNFSSIFQEGGQLTPFAPMCGRPCCQRQCQ